MEEPHSLQNWILQKPYWEKYLWKICAEKNVIEPADILYVYEQLLCDAGINETPVRENITSIGNLAQTDTELLPKLLLKDINSFDNVNALPNTEKVKFSKQLTILYGENGSGKSGISRLFGNACFYRGKKELLTNLKTNITTIPKANFNIEYLDGSFSAEYEYSLGEQISDLNRFYVFDTSSPHIHLDSPNNVNFTPSKLNIFNKVKEALGHLEVKIVNENKLLNKENPTGFVFANETDDVAAFFKNISANTPDDQIELFTTFGTNDEMLLNELGRQLMEKEKLDIPKRKQQLSNEVSNLKTLHAGLDRILNNVSTIKQSGLNDLIRNTKKQKDLTQKLSAEKFVHQNFKSIGNEKWTQLISVAKELYDYEYQFRQENDTCILCQQTLSVPAKTLFENYWVFLKDTAKKDYEALQKTVNDSITWMEKELNAFPSFEATNIAVSILEKDKLGYLNKLKQDFSSIKPVLEHWKTCLISLTDSNLNIPTASLEELNSIILLKAKEETELKDPAEEIKKLKNELAKLKNKKTASTLRTKIIEYKAYLVWVSKIRKTISFTALKTNLTKKRTDSFNEEVAFQYAKRFSDECKLLNGDFGLEIYTKGAEQDSVKGLRLNFAQKHAPSSILSEGEQKVCSIADFLTEVNLDINSAGIIFDDPVTSLDHARKQLIAERLVKEAKIRQVVILTHDIVFLLALENSAEREAVECLLQTVRKIADIPGYIKSDSPWMAMNMGKRVGYLKSELQRVTAVHKKGDDDEYRKEIKIWCEYLREAWERSIEESLFNGVITRFSPGIQTQRLEKVQITDEYKKVINEGMTESSKWIHDQASALNAPTPTPETALIWITSLENFLKNFK